MRTWTLLLLGVFVCGAGVAHASVTVLLEEPFGTFGGMNPTGHAAIYLSHVCAASPLQLRRCEPGEQGVVISRYHRVSGYDWIAIPLLPYLYAVDRPDEIPLTVTPEEAAALRDAYRRKHLENVAPDTPGGCPPEGDWIQLIGAAYDRTIYAFGIQTTAKQDGQFIQRFNSRPNKSRFNLLFHNCADFVRQAVDFYYPHAVHRSFITDAGIMTPKQAAKSLLSYGKRHRNLQFASFVIPQVPGTIPRSTRGPWRTGVPGEIQKVCRAAGFIGGAASSSRRQHGVRLAGRFAVQSAPDCGTPRLADGAGADCNRTGIESDR